VSSVFVGASDGAVVARSVVVVAVLNLGWRSSNDVNGCGSWGAHGHGNALTNELCWRSRSGLSDSAVGGGKFGEVLFLDALNAAAAIKLGSKALILLNKVRKLLGQLSILAGKAGNVCGQSVTLLELLSEAVLEITIALAGALIVLLDTEKLGLETGEFLLKLFDIAACLSVTLNHALELLGSLTVLVGE
jgi:hypothetical protein